MMTANDLVLQGISHDLRNNLTIMSGMLALLRRAKDDSRKERYMDQLELTFRNTRELLDRMNGSLVSEEAMPGQQIVELHSMLADMLGVFATAKPENMILEYTFRAQNTQVLSYNDTMKNAFLNLLLNARNAIDHDHGKISLTTYNQGNWLCVEVSDNGCGMTDEVIRRAFEPHYSTRGQGHGFGLTNAKRAFEENGGTITIASTPGRGTTMRVMLPVWQED